MTAYDIPTRFDRLPPCNLEAEESILGGILLDPSALPRVIGSLPPDAFFMDCHRKIYRACLNLHKRGQPTDLMTTTMYLHDRGDLDAIGGQNKMAQLVDRTISAVNIDQYAALVVEKYARRQLIETASQIAELAYEQRLELGAIAERIEEKVLSQTRGYCTKGDPDQWRYQRMIDSVREIQLKISNPGFREFKLQELSRQFNRSKAQLEDLYYRSLIEENNEPMMSLEELRQKYGGQIREWLIQGLMPKGSTILLHALGGDGKTIFSYYLLHLLLTGQDFDQFSVTAPQRRAMLVQTDEPAVDLIQRLEDRGFFEQQFPIRVKTRWSTDHIQDLIREIEEFRPDVLLIDSLTSVNRAVLFTENDVEYARPLLLLRDVAQKYNCTIIVIHHSNRGGEARGTTAIYNSVSEVWKLERAEKSSTSPERLLTIEKSRSRAPGRYKLKFNSEDKTWLLMGKEGEDENDPSITTRQLIINFLAQSPNTRFEAQEIHNEIGGTIDHVRRTAYQLAEDGQISRVQLKRVGKPYAYYLAFESSDHPHPMISNDQKMISNDDQKAKLDPTSISAITDHPTCKNAEIFENSENISAKTDDQKISNPPNPEPVSDSFLIIPSDHPPGITDHPDHPTDHDQESPSVQSQEFKVGDLVRLSNPDAGEEEWRGVVVKIVSLPKGDRWVIFWPDLLKTSRDPVGIAFPGDIELIDEVAEDREAIAKLDGKKSPRLNTLRKRIKEWELIGDSKPLKVEEGTIAAFFKAVPGGSRVVITDAKLPPIAFDSTFLNPKEIKDFVAKLANTGEAHTPCGKRVFKRKNNFIVFNQ